MLVPALSKFLISKSINRKLLIRKNTNSVLVCMTNLALVADRVLRAGASSYVARPSGWFLRIKSKNKKKLTRNNYKCSFSVTTYSLQLKNVCILLTAYVASEVLTRCGMRVVVGGR